MVENQDIFSRPPEKTVAASLIGARAIRNLTQKFQVFGKAVATDGIRRAGEQDDRCIYLKVFLVLSEDMLPEGEAL